MNGLEPNLKLQTLTVSALASVLSAAGLGWFAPANAEENRSALSPQMLEYAREASSAKPINQQGGDITAQNVTSVSQLSDVKPTDWAFTALQSLVERYGCIAGYPDRTYRGQRSMSRYEFAAGLNACLDKINEIISSGLADKVSKDDLAALQKLQEEFAAELAALRGRVEALEAKAAQLEAQQFSTTTKLEGQVIMAIAGSSGSKDLVSPNGLPSGISSSTNTTFISRVRLELNTSFTGKDLLNTRLEAGNGGQTIGNLLDSDPAFLGFTGFANSSVLDYSGSGSNFELGRLRYDFPVGDHLKVSVGPVISLNDHFDANSFANDEAVDFSIGMFINNPLILPVNDGAGGVIDWNPNGGAFSARVGYVAANAENPAAGVGEANAPLDRINRGLFGDPYQIIAELEFAPKNSEGTNSFAIRLQYTKANVNNLEYNAGGVNVEWAISPKFGIFGRYGFGSINSRDIAIAAALPTYVNVNTTGDTLNPSTWSAGFAFPDLFKDGALAGIAIGQPFIEGKVGNSTQTNLELFYSFPVSDNIRITPDLQFIFNPNNSSTNSTVTVGMIRTVFSF